MDDQQLFGSLTKKQMEEYKQEAKKRWGHTDAYKQSIERTKHLTKADWDKIQAEHEDISRNLAASMDKPVDSDAVQQLVDRHYLWISRFYDCPYEMYRNLGNMYVDDPRFTATYDKHRSGLAHYLSSAIAYYCDKKQKQK